MPASGARAASCLMARRNARPPGRERSASIHPITRLRAPPPDTNYLPAIWAIGPRRFVSAA
jgi:hypothetical protein